MVQYRTHIICWNKPGHFSRGRQLPVNKALDFRLCPPIVNIDNGQHVPFSRLKFVLDAMLVPFAFHFHRGQHETIAHKMSRITDPFGCFEAGIQKREIMKYQSFHKFYDCNHCIVKDVVKDAISLINEVRGQLLGANKNYCIVSNFYNKLKFPALFSGRNRCKKSAGNFKTV